MAVWAREGGGRIFVGGRIVGLLTASPGLVGADMTEGWNISDRVIDGVTGSQCLCLQTETINSGMLSVTCGSIKRR